MALSATPAPGEGPPFTTVLVTGLTDHVGGTLTVRRVDPDGTASPLRQVDPNIVIDAAEMSFIDYEAPYGASVTYSAVATLDPEPDLSQSSAPVTLDPAGAWLVHPGTPAISQPLTITDLGLGARVARRTVLTPVGRALPVILTDGARKAASGSLSVLVSDLAARDALMTLTADLTPLRMSLPAGWNWGVGSEWVSVADISEVSWRGGDQARVIGLPFDVCDRPVGALTLSRTWSDVLGEAGSWTDLMALYSTWLGVYTGVAGV